MCIRDSGGGEQVQQRAEQAVLGIGRIVEAAAMAGQVQRDQVVGGQVRRHRQEAGGIVQPAMHRQQLRAAGAVVAQRDEAAAGGVQHDLCLLYTSRCV